MRRVGAKVDHRPMFAHRRDGIDTRAIGELQFTPKHSYRIGNTRGPQREEPLCCARLTEAIRNGARVMVCGGREMARGVAEALEEILAPVGLSPALLKAEGRYAEDVY